ncbi:MAG: hypothetical protein COU22_00495, partial [Candidatus Komeilibacteria bacterium CG10_big_fil_rev_8_21_14_0_10_41_13]
LQWLKDSLTSKGYEAKVPAMPNPEEPEIEAWLKALHDNLPDSVDENIILVGHSIGCQAVLRYLERLPQVSKICGLLLLAPWMELDQQTLKEEGEEVKKVARPWMETPIDFTKVKSMVGKVVAIFSDNDPYVPLAQKDLFARELGAEIIIEHNRGHFDPSSRVKELSSALEAILKF